MVVAAEETAVEKTQESAWGKKCAENGHPEPYKVKYWGIANEIWGPHEVGHCGPEAYGEGFVTFARTMRAVDPEIKLVAVGAMPEGPFKDWNERVLSVAEAAKAMDYLSVHRYYGQDSNNTILIEEGQATLMGAIVF